LSFLDHDILLLISAVCETFSQATNCIDGYSFYKNGGLLYPL